MIKTFRSKRLARYWMKGDARGLSSVHLKRLTLRLTALDEAVTPDDMNVPGWHFHALSGDRQGRYAVRVTGNWRLTFGWDESAAAAIDVDYEDYH
jgi:proteic killer suppression protein